MKIKELFKNLALLLITIIIFMILFEIALRFFYPQNLSRTQLDKHLLFSNRADLDNVHYNRWNEFNQYISTNSRGLRDYEYSYEKINNSFRILMLGDSFVEGVEVAAENTTSKLLEKQLNQLENGIHYDVINFGVGGWSFCQFFWHNDWRWNPTLSSFSHAHRSSPTSCSGDGEDWGGRTNSCRSL